MELYKQILSKILANSEAHIVFPNLNLDTTQLIENSCYQILSKVVDIIKNDELNDSECFAKIEAIVQLFEPEEIDSGTRHDFG